MAHTKVTMKLTHDTTKALAKYCEVNHLRRDNWLNEVVNAYCILNKDGAVPLYINNNTRLWPQTSYLLSDDTVQALQSIAAVWDTDRNNAFEDVVSQLIELNPQHYMHMGIGVTGL
jgi:hypothetical protein